MSKKKFNLRYFLLREFYRWEDKFNGWRIHRHKQVLRKRYERNRVLLEKVPNIYIHNYGYEWVYQSSIQDKFLFNLVTDPEKSDAIIFQTKVDESLKLKNKDIYLFYGEPKIYTQVHFNNLSQNFFDDNRVTVISHHPSPLYFLDRVGPYKFIRAILHNPYFHAATAEDLSAMDGKIRKKTMFTITSALAGIEANDNKKKYIEKLIERGCEIDLFGRFSRAAFSVKNYRGTCAYKYKLLGQYKYNLILENTPDEDWWISEKIYDALLCGCMPIYHGSNKIFEVLPSEWFYYLPNFEDSELQKMEEFIKTDAYLIISSNRKEIADFIDKNFSFFSAIEKIVNHLPLRQYIKE